MKKMSEISMVEKKVYSCCAKTQRQVNIHI